MDDKTYLEKLFKIRVGYDLNLDNPQGINEKIQWLKLNDLNPEHCIKADKYLVRDYVKKTVGDKYLVPLYGVWDKFDDIDFLKLPNKFVLKCNHNSGSGMIVCNNKEQLDLGRCRKIITNSLNENYFFHTREFVYKNIKRKIICEKYLEPSNGKLDDYKFWIINGKFRLLMICVDRDKEVKMNFYDEELNLLKLSRGHKNFKQKYIFPDNILEMIEVSERLAGNDVFVRVDLYNVDGKIYFGELTFFPGAGLEAFKPEEYDFIIGNMLNLEGIKKKI